MRGESRFTDRTFVWYLPALSVALFTDRASFNIAIKIERSWLWISLVKNQFVHFDFLWYFLDAYGRKTVRYLFTRSEAYFAPFFSREGYVVFCNESNYNFEDRYLSVL
jgi:hypothetical protein